MKVQELFAPYLYQHKKLTLPGIGTFVLKEGINIYELKEESWPADAITFHPDSRAGMDEAFLNYLVEQTGKMKVLAQSDLDSYINNGLQLLNIGKPLQLKGIGLLSKSSDGHFAFTQGQPMPEKGNVPEGHYVLKDRTRQPEDAGSEIDFAAAERRSSRKPFIIIASILALALLAWAIYLAIPQKERDLFFEDTSVNQPAAPPSADTAVWEKTAAPSDTATAPATLEPPTVPPVTDSSSGFRMLLHTYKYAAAATERLNVLKGRGHDVRLLQQDSTYRIVLQVNRPLQDTAYVRDSLYRWYRFAAKFFQ
ncbi:MAG: hypothetical protein ACK4E8_02710 [Lacibacter sp.]